MSSHDLSLVCRILQLQSTDHSSFPLLHASLSRGSSRNIWPTALIAVLSRMIVVATHLNRCHLRLNALCPDQLPRERRLADSSLT
jgi:hypothetical protein